MFKLKIFIEQTSCLIPFIVIRCAGFEKVQILHVILFILRTLYTNYLILIFGEVKSNTELIKSWNFTGLLGYFVRTSDHSTLTTIESLNVNNKKRTKTVAKRNTHALIHHYFIFCLMAVSITNLLHKSLWLTSKLRLRINFRGRIRYGWSKVLLWIFPHCDSRNWRGGMD